MNDTQVAPLDHTIQQTNTWLKKLGSDHHLGDRPHGYNALRAVLHVLRGCLTPEQAVHLRAQLPTLVRRIYYEGWRFAGKPTNEPQPDEFAKRVAAQLPPQFSRDALSVMKAVLDLLGKELDPGETMKVIRALPAPLRAMWSDLTRRSTPQL